MANVLDVRGLSCPIPLIKTQAALAIADIVSVLVDEPPAKENIIRYAKSQNFRVECSEAGGEYTINISK
ncbi:sulfurtransferase TusA family protein [Sporomusa sp.]|jgi:TusA-related sulfurtransferase|uniref:sulfurtransferase TusA family protein n=1 Tax=Sporomusa sp. TaxID=2078658 RepID=UPI002BF34D7F|nr:sulfurtransferase TusA family protein [Sporomusa sp.]HWR06111.1 sulfurtransferase TusA family protein [Sporomusa sp.]